MDNESWVVKRGPEGDIVTQRRDVESFFATLKKEQIHRRKYDTMEDVRRDMF